MLEFIHIAVLAVCAAISVCAVCYLAIAIGCVARLPLITWNGSQPVPATTVLKPLCGDEPLLREALLSFCTQRFPAPLQIIFGVRSSADPASAIARELKAQYPEVDIEVVVDPTVHGPNLKVSNLINMMRFAKHDVIVVSDSDVHIPPDCLQKITVRLAASSAVGITCPFRGAPARLDNWVAQLGALYIDALALPAIVVDATLFGVKACYGPLTALRREFVTALDDFRALVSMLVDDAEIGTFAAHRGQYIELAPFVVDTTISETRFDQLLIHELRWARTTRAVRPGQYVASLVTHALPVALIMVALHPSPVSALLFGSIAALRAMLLAVVAAGLGRAPTAAMPTPWFLIFAEFIYLGVWLWAFTGRTIVWRGHRLRILPGGRIVADGWLPTALPSADRKTAT
jgi:ceramide glucosyltransferase